jgi:antitoxin component of MazEF toxin-antitoxin module
MKKEIKKYGNAYVIKLDAEDRKIYNLDEGDIVDIEICKVKEKSK